MSESIAAEIHIGGKVRRSVVQALCGVISQSGASLEWGGGSCQIGTPEELLEARSADDDGPLVLKLYDDQASWGQFEELETFLRDHGIPYRRFSEGKYQYDPEAVAFHPQCGLVSWLTDHAQEPVVLASHLEPILAKLTDLLEAIKGGRATTASVAARLEEIRDGLRAELPPAVPLLETLEIVED